MPGVAQASAVAMRIAAALGAAREERRPFRHWLLADVFPESVCAALAGLPLPVPPVPPDGRRELINSRRIFFTPGNQAAFPVCAAVARAFQALEVIATVEGVCEVALAGTTLRIEYCQDTDGFWLEPHTDIGAKLFTMLIYLPEAGDTAELGTDIYAGPEHHAGSAPYGRNRGLMFVPGADTWHGFRRRPIDGSRRSIIVNFVSPEWRSRHELCSASPVPSLETR
jgi:hypothetical protein